MLFAPESVVQKNGAVLQGAVSPDLGLVWSKDGVSRLFGSQQADALNVYKAPSSLVLVTADRFVRTSKLDLPLHNHFLPISIPSLEG